MRAELPHSPACERNRGPILEVLRRHFADRQRVLEIGSGTGQHAVHFAAALPHLIWQTSDRPDYLPGIGAWLEHAGLSNTPPILELDVGRREQWPTGGFDAAFSANTLHIMAWAEVQLLFELLGRTLTADAKLAVYGPFKYAGEHTSQSNAAFDAQLRLDAPQRGVRDIESVEALAKAQGFALKEDIAMPANNRCLVWQRSAATHANRPA